MAHTARMDSADEAQTAARRLHVTATALLVLASIVFGTATVSGAALAVLTNDRTTRISGIASAAGGFSAWLVSALLCTAGQAVARYIAFKAD